MRSSSSRAWTSCTPSTPRTWLLAHAYDLTDEEAARILDMYEYRNVARSILRPPRVNLEDELGG